MKNVIRLLSVFFLSGFVMSCQKEPDVTLDPVNPPVVIKHDSVTRLAKIFYIDSKISNTDTSSYGVYAYDSLQRVITIKGYHSDAGTQVFDGGYTYFYKAKDSLAYKMLYEENDPVYPLAQTHFYFYDNSKRLIKDSVIYTSTQTEVAQYVYSASSVSGVIRYTDVLNPQYNKVYKDTGFAGNTGDIIKTNTLTGVSDPLTGYVESYVTTFVYDDKPNPFFQLNIRSTYNPVPGFNFFLEDFYLQKNNIVSSSETEPSIPGSTSAVTYTYTYNALGLPATVDIAYSFGQTDDYRLVFIYKKI